MDFTDSRAKAALIKDRVSMADVIARYHHPGRRFGRTSCPFHGGEHDNLGYDKRVFHCFVCGAKGDVISFTRRINGLDFPGAVKLLDADFGIGLERMNSADRDDLRRAALEREAERLERTRAQEFAMRVSRLFGRVQYWALHRAVQTDMHTRCVDSLDRVIDDLQKGKKWSCDPKTFARSWVWAVKGAEREAKKHGG